MKNRTLLIAAFVFIGVVFWTVSYVLDLQEQKLSASITDAVNTQHQRLVELAELTDKNGTDPVVQEVVVDCKIKDRVRFDELLSELSTLTPAELNEIQSLFDNCADYFARRTQLMTELLRREYEYYSTLVNLLTTTEEPASINRYGVSQWEKVVELESRRSQIFAERVRIQEEIINDLKAGERPNSKTVLDRAAEANEMTEELLVIDKQCDELRERLHDI